MGIDRGVSPELDAAVAHVYAIFGRYALSCRDLVVCRCPCCVRLEDERKLVSMQLREIPATLLAQYTNSAHIWDERVSREMRYFLPRYCELIAQDDPPPGRDIELCLSRLGRDAQWRDKWADEEVAALQKFLIALLLDRLSRIETTSYDWRYFGLQERVDEVLVMAITAGAELSTLLAAWDAAPEPGATLHMAAIRFAVRHYDDSRPPRLPNPYLKHYRVEAEAIAAFVMRDEVASRIEAAFFATDDEAHQSLLSAAVGPLWGQQGADQ